MPLFPFHGPSSTACFNYTIDFEGGPFYRLCFTKDYYFTT